ncbi:MAG TPA: hypothetical protein VK934_10715, partial [Fimbriimonas sp.]|nr:hypothetical protein [Fimbriimonas sp.]
MLTALLMPLIAFQGEAPKSLYVALFPKPTGLNGYEEVSRAVDLARKLNLAIYQSWIPPERRPKPDPEGEKNVSKEIREFEAAFSPPKNPAVEALRTR